jgi:hypothetical protein
MFVNEEPYERLERDHLQRKTAKRDSIEVTSSSISFAAKNPLETRRNLCYSFIETSAHNWAHAFTSYISHSLSVRDTQSIQNMLTYQSKICELAWHYEFHALFLFDEMYRTKLRFNPTFANVEGKLFEAEFNRLLASGKLVQKTSSHSSTSASVSTLSPSLSLPTAHGDRKRAREREDKPLHRGGSAQQHSMAPRTPLSSSGGNHPNYTSPNNGNNSSSSGPARDRRSPSQQACRNFNAGSCTRNHLCGYSHICTVCGGQHPATHCK